jgi:anaerobic selenocysteine-containing dehydrogenase
MVRVASVYGDIEAPVFIYPAIRPDTVAIPLGQGHSEFGRYAEERGANAVRLLGPATDRTGNYLAFSTVRVHVFRTGEQKKLAVFGSLEGSYEEPPF